MMKDEQELCSKIIFSLRKITKFAYKIPDTLGQKFTPSKPFDLFSAINGTPVAIEVKILGLNESLRYSLLRSSQIAGLEDWQESGGASFVAAGYFDAKSYFLLIVDYSELKKRRIIKPNEFVNYPYRYAFQNDYFDFRLFAQEMRYYF